jgi:Predicted DNA alkylation repair enzyme
MTKVEVFQIMESQKNERGIAHWQKMNNPLTSFGLGLTQLKKIAKQVGRNHDLALELWKSDNYDARNLATMVDEPKKVSRQQVENQVAEMETWMFSHVYCSNLMPKLSFLQELVEDWKGDKDEMRRRCAYLGLYQLAKNNKKLTDEYFEAYIKLIEKDLKKEAIYVKDAMNSALYMMGMRSKALNKRAVEVAQKIGKVEIDYGDNSCEALDVHKHLTSDRVKKKFA